MSTILQKYIDAFRNGDEFDPAEAEPFLDGLISESDESLLAESFRAWNAKGIEENEIYEFARILRGRMKTVNSRHEDLADIVGTGGSKAKTFNVSTAAAFVVAGAGVAVAKHGNKAATSNSGSADVLAELGIDPAADPKLAEHCLNELGICFMFAPNHHRLSPTLAKVRRGLGFPTIFNCVGPLCNPASAPNQLIGVWDEGLVTKMAAALARLGTKRSWVVHGTGGLDEIALNGPTSVAEVADGEVRTFETSPSDFGIRTAATNTLHADDAKQSAAMIRSILEGKPLIEASNEIVILNAAAMIHIATNTSFLEATKLASGSLRSGKAKAKLEQLAGAAPK